MPRRAGMEHHADVTDALRAVMRECERCHSSAHGAKHPPAHQPLLRAASSSKSCSGFAPGPIFLEWTRQRSSGAVTSCGRTRTSSPAASAAGASPSAGARFLRQAARMPDARPCCPLHCQPRVQRPVGGAARTASPIAGVRARPPQAAVAVRAGCLGGEVLESSAAPEAIPMIERCRDAGAIHAHRTPRTGHRVHRAAAGPAPGRSADLDREAAPPRAPPVEVVRFQPWIEMKMITSPTGTM